VLEVLGFSASRRSLLVRRVGVVFLAGASLGAAALAKAATLPAKIEPAEVVEITKDWPEAARNAARDIMQKYGPPQEATPNLLIWRENGPWKRTVVHKDAAEHAFPKEHKDAVEQVVPYKVPVNFFNALAVYNGSVVADRTRGELTSFGDTETTNMLSLNLAHEVMRGRMSAEQAREAHTQAIRDMEGGKPPELAQKLLVGSPQGDLRDPDTATVTGTSTTGPVLVK
jgi:hypothetical protein